MPPPPSEMPLLTISSPSTIEKCKHLILFPNDIFICSYPKSGTTWTQHIILSLLLRHRQIKEREAYEHENENEHDVHVPKKLQLPYGHVSDYAPFFEIDPHWSGEQLIPEIRARHAELGRRIFNTHLRWDMLPSDSNNNEEPTHAKFIYILRSPLDVCVSFYHHLSHQVEGCYEHSLTQFFHEWMDGKLPFGSWDDHVCSYLPAMACEKNVFLLSYEDMVQDLQGCVEKLVEFLELGDTLNETDVADLLPSFTFEHMKKDLDRFQPKSVTWKNDFQFLRKGKIGEHKVELGTDERKAFEQYLKEKNFSQDVKAVFGTNLDTSNKILNLV